MKAPEKIYVHELSAMELTTPIKEYHIEYVRADAFIEKATLFFIDKLKELPMDNGKMKIKINKLLEDFIDDFVNYMKKEQQ